jgi:hypothetical protein
VDDARRHDADIAIGDRRFHITDPCHPGSGHELQQLVVPFVDLAADIAPLGDGHQHQLCLFAGPQNFAELVVLPGEFDDWSRVFLRLGHLFNFIIQSHGMGPQGARSH